MAPTPRRMLGDARMTIWLLVTRTCADPTEPTASATASNKGRLDSYPSKNSSSVNPRTFWTGREGSHRDRSPQPPDLGPVLTASGYPAPVASQLTWWAIRLHLGLASALIGSYPESSANEPVAILPAGSYVPITTPVVETSLSTSFSALGMVPSANRRFPEPTTSGKTHSTYRSISPCRMQSLDQVAAAVNLEFGPVVTFQPRDTLSDIALDQDRLAPPQRGTALATRRTWWHHSTAWPPAS